MSGLPSLAALEGRWVLERVIRHQDGREDVFSGQSSFKRSGPRMVQDEDGVLTPARGGTSMKATRRYVWASAGNSVEVAFEDMRPFHSIPLGTPTPGTTCLCPPDRYEVSYDFSAYPEWTSTWDVEGPRKAYRMISTFRRDNL